MFIDKVKENVDAQLKEIDDKINETTAQIKDHEINNSFSDCFYI